MLNSFDTTTLCELNWLNITGTKITQIMTNTIVNMGKLIAKSLMLVSLDTNYIKNLKYLDISDT